MHWMEVTYRKKVSPIREAKTPGKVIGHRFLGERHTTERLAIQLLISKEDVSLRIKNHHISIEQKSVLRTTVVVIVKSKTAVRIEIQQAGVSG